VGHLCSEIAGFRAAMFIARGPIYIEADALQTAQHDNWRGITLLCISSKVEEANRSSFERRTGRLPQQ